MLNVRKPKFWDIIPMLKLLGDDYTAHMLGFKRGLYIAEVSRYITRNKEHLFIFEDKYKNFVGYFKTDLRDALPTATIAIDRSERRKGYAVEMYRTILKMDVKCMVATAFKDNQASISTLKKCGFKKLPTSNNPDKVAYLYESEVR